MIQNIYKVNINTSQTGEIKDLVAIIIACGFPKTLPPVQKQLFKAPAYIISVIEICIK